MNIDAIKSTVKQIPSKAKGAIDYVGASAIDAAKSAKTFIKNNVKISIPKNDTFESLSKNLESAKQSVKSTNAYEFVKNNKETLTGSAVVLGIGKFLKENKETVAGAAVVLAAIACIAKLIKNISGKSEDNQQKVLYYKRG